MRKWEYHFLTWNMAGSTRDTELSIQQATKELNVLGEEGWELVFVMPTIGVLKHPKE